jgi:hypothetical protein
MACLLVRTYFKLDVCSSKWFQSVGTIAYCHAVQLGSALKSESLWKFELGY